MNRDFKLLTPRAKDSFPIQRMPTPAQQCRVPEINSSRMFANEPWQTITFVQQIVCVFMRDILHVQNLIELNMLARLY